MGDILFRSAGGELMSVNTADKAGREAYRRAWQQRRDQLTQLANGTGCAMIPLLTNHDVHKSLMKGLERRMRMRAFL